MKVLKIKYEKKIDVDKFSKWRGGVKLHLIWKITIKRDRLLTAAFIFLKKMTYTTSNSIFFSIFSLTRISLEVKFSPYYQIYFFWSQSNWCVTVICSMMSTFLSKQIWARSIQGCHILTIHHSFLLTTEFYFTSCDNRCPHCMLDIDPTYSIVFPPANF